MYTPGVRAAPACRNAQNRKDPTEQICGVLIDADTMPRQLRLCGHRRCSHAITGAAAAATRGHPAGRTAAEPVRRAAGATGAVGGRRSAVAGLGAVLQGRGRRSGVVALLSVSGLGRRSCRSGAWHRRYRGGLGAVRGELRLSGLGRTGLGGGDRLTARGAEFRPPLAHTRSAMRTEHENPFFLFGLSGR